jgi:hypothetical protein
MLGMALWGDSQTRNAIADRCHKRMTISGQLEGNSEQWKLRWDNYYHIRIE